MRLVLQVLVLALLASCNAAPPAVQLHPAGAAPPLLSEWSLLFSQGGALRLNDRVTPYQLNTPLFSDYALKLRTVWLPDGSVANYNADRELDFPVGTIISKTFFYRRGDSAAAGPLQVVSAAETEPPLSLTDYVILETRLLVRYDEGWQAFPYVWNAAQTDATLEIAGDVKPLALTHNGETQNFNYVVPDVNQCAGCHTPDHSAAELRPLGPKAWQLNRATAWWPDERSQLHQWEAAGLLAGVPAAMPALGDSLPDRARQYLDANCAHCHNPRGAADTSALHLNVDAPQDRNFGLCKSPVAVGRGSGDLNYDIYPGRPDESIVIYRMQHSDPAIAMPELGRSTVHAEGVELIASWITSLPGEC